MYSEKVMEHFRNPRNVGEIENADGVGEIGNPVCGDMMTFYVKIDNGTLTDVRFKTFGCGAAIAVSSMVSEMAKGKTVDEAMKISNADVAKELGGLPPWVSLIDALVVQQPAECLDSAFSQEKAESQRPPRERSLPVSWEVTRSTFRW